MGQQLCDRLGFLVAQKIPKIRNQPLLPESVRPNSEKITAKEIELEKSNRGGRFDFSPPEVLQKLKLVNKIPQFRRAIFINGRLHCNAIFRGLERR